MLLLAVLIFSFSMSKASVISSANFNFSATAKSFVDDLFDELEQLDFEFDFELFIDDLRYLSCFSTSLSQVCTLCLKEKTGQSLHNIAHMYTSHQCFLAPLEFQKTFWTYHSAFLIIFYVFCKEYIRSSISLNFLITLTTNFDNRTLNFELELWT